MNNNKLAYISYSFKIIILHVFLAFFLSAFHTSMKSIDIQNNSGYSVVNLPARGRSVKPDPNQLIMNLAASCFLEKYIAMWNESRGYALSGRLLSEDEIKKIAIVLMNDDEAKEALSELMFSCHLANKDQKFHTDFRWYLKWFIMPMFMFRSFLSIMRDLTSTLSKFSKEKNYFGTGYSLCFDGLWYYCFDVLPLLCFFKYLKKTREDSNKKLEEALDKKISSMALLIYSNKE